MFERERRTAGAAASPTPLARRLLLPLAFLALLAALFASQNGPTSLAHATDVPTTVVVKPSTVSNDLSQPTGWTFYDDTNDVVDTANGAYVPGPTGALNTGSAQLTVADSPAREALLTRQFDGIALTDINTLSFDYSSTPSKGVYLQFDLNVDGTATGYQGRLGFIPNTPTAGTWTSVNALDDNAGMWSVSSGHGLTACTQASPCTWTQVKDNYGQAKIGNPDTTNGPKAGNLVFRIGNPGGNYTANVDNFHIETNGTNAINEVFDFEPDGVCGDTCYVDASATGTGDGTSVTPFTHIQDALDAVNENGTVSVAAGTYNEDLNISTTGVKLIGAGAGTGIDDPAATTIIGTKTDSPADTVYVGAVNVTVQGVNITRAGNNAVDWDNHLKVQGIMLRADGATLQDSRVTGNRNGVYVFYADGVTIKNNDIIDNRTGIQVNDGTGATVSDNLTIENNTIEDNWTLGILFNHVQSNTGGSTGIVVRNNNIAGNWYGGIEDRWAGSQPIDATNNWYGSVTPSVLAGDSGEPGYAALIPTKFGGTSTPPSPLGQDIIWNNNTSNQLTFIPLLCNGTDTDGGALGFVPGATSCQPGATQPPSGEGVASSNSGVIDGTSGNTTISDGAGFEATYSGTGTVYTQLATYTGNPEADTGGFFGTGGEFFDVFVSILSPDPTATLAVTFPGLTDGQVLRWWDGTAWQTVRNNDGSTPVVSGGTTTVTFGASSSPRLDQLDGTPISSGDPNAIEVQLVSGTSVAGGQQVTVQVVAKAANLQAVDVSLSYDPDFLKVIGCSNITLGTGLSHEVDFTYPSAAPVVGCSDSANQGAEFDDTNGHLRFTYGQSGPSSVTGSDIVLATITFTGQAANNITSTSISVDSTVAWPTKFSDNNGIALPLTLTPPVTLSNIGGGGAVLTGTVQLQGLSDWSGTTVTLIDAGQNIVATSLVTAANGHFSLSVVGIESGNYTIVAVHEGYLRAGSTTFTFGSTTTALPTVTLLGGDYNGDGIIDTNDLGILANNWGATSWTDLGATTVGTGVMQPTQHKTPDFNGDTSVDVLDLGVLAANFGKSTTADAVWPVS